MRDITITRLNEMIWRPWPNESHWKLYQEQLWVMPGCMSAQASHIIKDKLWCQLTVLNLTRWNCSCHALQHLTSMLARQQELHDTCELLQVAGLKATEFTFVQQYVKVNVCHTPVKASLPTISALFEKTHRLESSC